MTEPTPKLYLDQNYPLAMVQQVEALQSKELKPPSQLLSGNQPRYWLSQSRRMDSPFLEIITVNFKQPSSVSKIAFDLLQISQNWTAYYYNRSGQRVALRDLSYGELKGTISSGELKSWYTIDKQIYPIVATKIEIVLQRVPDFNAPASLVIPLGMRNLLLKREVYDRKDATLPLENSTDPMGNLVVKTVKDWDPGKAVDTSVYTYWKSSPQPSPDAVVAFYMDVRNDSQQPQRIDRIFLDPVHAGQFLNVYYSSDHTVRTRRLGTTQMAPITQLNCSVDERGLKLNQSDSNYVLDGKQIGLKRSQSFWMALGWTPNFPSNTPPPLNLTLFTAGTGDTLFSVVYQVMTKRFTVTLGSKIVTTSAIQFGVGVDIEVVVSVVRPIDNPQSLPTGITVYITDVGGHIITSATLPCDPPSCDFLPTMSFKNVEGYINSVLVKQESMDVGILTTYLANKDLYLVPDPVARDGQGLLPSTSLDNAILCADFTTQSLAYGGVDQSYFEDKKWTPIFRDFVVTRGFQYFPKPVMAGYIKLEFTNLTEEQYPIWEDGISVKYASYPISVTKTSTQTNTSYTAQKITNGKVQNISSTSVSRAFTSSTTLTQNISIKVGDTSLTDVPKIYDKPPSTTLRSETQSSTVYNKTTKSSKTIADIQTYTVVSGDYLIKIAKKYDLDWDVIYKANKKLIDSDPRVSKLPSRSPGWWIFPGQKLKIPTSVMKQITKTTTKVERKKTTKTTRTRFTVTQVHRYQIQSVTRDSAIAYFAGLRNVQAYRLDYGPAEDTNQYTILQYDDSDFTLTNTSRQLDGTVRNSSPTSGTGRANLVLNPGFETDLYGWYTSSLPVSTTPDSVAPKLTRTQPGYLSENGLTVDFMDLSKDRTLCTDVATTPGQQYTFSIFGDTLDPNQSFRVSALRGDGSLVHGSFTTTGPGTGGYQRPSVVFTANSAITTFCVHLKNTDLTLGTVLLLDGALAEIGNVSGAPYFDGNTQFCSWSDPTRPNRSTSSEYLDVTRNYIINPSFEYGLDSWMPWRGTPGYEQSTLSAFGGTHSMRITWSVTGTGNNESVGTIVTGLRIGQTYTLSGYAYIPSGSPDIVFRLGDGGAGAVSDGTRNQYRRVQLVFTATSTIQPVYVSNIGTTDPGDQAYIDCVQLVLGTSPGTYFDGDVAGFTWIGQPGLSQSVQLKAATTRGTITSRTWNSTSIYKRISLEVFDSGLRTPSSGIVGVGPVGITPGAPVATWNDMSVKWADPASPWGAPLPLVTATFDPSRQFQGRTAALFYRAANQGAAVGGVTSRLFSGYTGTRIRYSTTLFLTAQTTNQYQIQLYNADTNAILFSENITPKPGNWFTYTSHFQVLTQDYLNLAVRVLVQGNDLEYMYVGELRVDLATILYEVSNDDGVNFYDATEAIYTKDAFFVFPTENNKFRIRATLNAPDDYGWGFEMTPLYLN